MNRKAMAMIAVVFALAGILSFSSFAPYISEAQAQPRQSTEYCFTSTEANNINQHNAALVCFPTQAECETARASGAFGGSPSPSCHQRINTIPPGR